MIVIFTTAPEAYDYGSTTVLVDDVGEVEGHGMADGTVRVVKCTDVQLMRYRSGCFLATDDLDLVKELSGITDEDLEPITVMDWRTR